MSTLLELRGTTVELPTAAGWVRPVNDVSLRIAAGESLGLVGEYGPAEKILHESTHIYTKELLAAVPAVSRPGQL